MSLDEDNRLTTMDMSNAYLARKVFIGNRWTLDISYTVDREGKVTLFHTSLPTLTLNVVGATTMVRVERHV